jgi:cytochrome c peroxidase
MKTRAIIVAWVLAWVAAAVGTAPLGAQTLMGIEQLGKSIFLDQNLSIDQNQSCAACHGPDYGFTGPIDTINAHGAVYQGSIPGRFGNRKPPSATYATLSPILYVDRKGLFTGGNFWDGRATGEKLGNPAADQAQGPFLNPLEQALGTPADVVEKVCESAYENLFKSVWGAAICDPTNIDHAYDAIALSIAAYEASPEVNAFTSKYDLTFKGKAKLSKLEQKGYAIFRGKGKCHRCHIGNGQHALFTDFTYDNLGVPKNPENPFYTELTFNPLGASWIDEGLGGFLASRLDYASYADDNRGKQKVPTLRNVGKAPSASSVKAYTHNGYFKTLEGIVHFYNTRDVLTVCPGDYTEDEALAANCWPLPEYPGTVNMDELGDLGLTSEEEEALVAFLMTLSDGYSNTP